MHKFGDVLRDLPGDGRTDMDWRTMVIAPAGKSAFTDNPLDTVIVLKPFTKMKGISWGRIGYIHELMVNNREVVE